jgi:hypothetical protein
MLQQTLFHQETPMVRLDQVCAPLPLSYRLFCSIIELHRVSSLDNYYHLQDYQGCLPTNSSESLKSSHRNLMTCLLSRLITMASHLG